MYTPSRHSVRGSPYRSNQIPEGPIQDFATIIENTQPEDWQRRTSAFMALVNTIPSGSEYSNGQAWYNSPPVLRHMAHPLSALLSDARSTVVKRTCEYCTDLFAKCQSDARYLLKDIMPTILAVHAQTVQVIRTYVQNMVMDTMGVCPCKMCMPMWLDRLKSDKSRTVREACCIYLGVGLSEWTEPGYLTKEIWVQVGAALIKALRDSAPQVRNHARRGVETVYQQQPAVFDKLLQDMDLTRDMRVKRLLIRIQNGETVGDDVSVASSRVGSVASRSVRSGRIGGMGRKTAQPSPYLRAGSQRGGPSANNNRTMGIPKTIGVATGSPYSAAPAPPPRPTAVDNKTRQRGLGPPLRMGTPFKSAVESPPKISRKAIETTTSATTPTNNMVTNGTPTSVITQDKALGNSFDTTDTAESELHPIANTTELREVAKTRNSRRSSLLLERIQRSNSVSNSNNDLLIAAGESHDSLLDDLLDKPSNDLDDEDLPEHTKIAHAVLEAHKAHVDQIMETLKVEMDALKEFELVLLEEGPRRPTEDEVLEYFESVGLCLEQRSKAGSNLQKKMDRISRGADS